MNTPRNDEYVAELEEELELRDVPPEAVTSITQDVSSHLADSGEDPLDAFGSPKQYADEIARPTASRRLLIPIMILAAALGAAGGLFLIRGIFGILDPSVEFWGLTPVALLVIGALLLSALFTMLAVMAQRSRRRRERWKP